jgi:dolichol-phosphate mannosyltransferase
MRCHVFSQRIAGGTYRGSGGPPRPVPGGPSRINYGVEVSAGRSIKLSIVIPSYNESRTLRACIERVLAIADETLSLEIIIVDDCSTDGSLPIAQELQKTHEQIILLCHEVNRGKGAALRTGFKRATGDFVAVQDADLEYDPRDLKRILAPLIDGDADVVLGSRFLSAGTHRVLYFWHYLANRFLTIFSNMFTDLNLTDMECCYKVFRREVIQSLDILENRFGFEPEIVAKVAHMRLRVYEAGVSYYGRTYAEGKKIGFRDGVRALYCICHYSAHVAPWPIQLFLYLFIGGISAVVNFLVFMGLFHMGFDVMVSAPAAYIVAAVVNYGLCIVLLFRHRARWNSLMEFLIFLLVVFVVGIMDLGMTKALLELGNSPGLSKMLATGAGLIFNFLGRRFLVFPEPPSGPWEPQVR